MQEPELRKLAVLPILLIGVAYVVVVLAAAFFVDDLQNWFWARPDGSMLLVLWYVVLVLAFFLLMLVLGMLSLAMVSILAGPFYEKMATWFLKRAGLELVDPSFTTGLASSVLRIFIFVLPAAACGVVGLIPYIGLPFVAVALVLGWLAAAAEAWEPTLLCTGMRASSRLRFVLGSTSVTLGLGAVTSLTFLVPFLPLVSVPSAILGAASLFVQSSTRK